MIGNRLTPKPRSRALPSLCILKPDSGRIQQKSQLQCKRQFVTMPYSKNVFLGLLRVGYTPIDIFLVCFEFQRFQDLRFRDLRANITECCGELKWCLRDLIAPGSSHVSSKCSQVVGDSAVPSLNQHPDAVTWNDLYQRGGAEGSVGN